MNTLKIGNDLQTTSLMSIVNLFSIRHEYHQEHVSKSNDDDNDVERISIDKEVLVNIDCPVGLILDYVREVARLDKTCKVDLCDELNCQLKNLSMAEPSTSGLYLLQPDITYFVVIITNNTNDQSTTLIPLVSTKVGKKCMEIFKKNRQKKK